MGNCRCKIWHRVVTALLALTFLSAYLPEDIIDLDITASAETYTTEDGFKYTISDGEVTITGYSGDATDVVIPNEIGGCSVTSIIGSHYTKNFENAVSIEIPNSVREINDYAFFNCENLTSVIIPDSVIVVGFCAFSQCDSLSSISIPSSVLSIDEMAFADCDILKDIYFSEGLITVGERAFWNCVSLENIIIPNSATSIGDYAFSECNNLKSVALPKRITAIGNYVFENCTELIDINFGDSVTSIGNYAFFNCSTLHYLSIPNGVINIGDSAFAQCDNLSSITFPATIKYIGNSAFYSCDNLNNVLIPNSVTEIGNSAFAYCTGLTNIILPDSITSISDMIFLECRNLLNINIPNGIVSIGSSAFSYCGMNSITIPRSVTQIDTSAFYHLGSDFLICGYAGSYAETYANENNIPFEVIDDTDNDMPKSGKCGADINWEFTDDGILKIYGTGGFWDYNYSASFPSIISNFDIQQIVIGDGITYIGSGAFSGCNAKKVSIPNSATLIGTYAFNGCYSLTEIIIPDSITSVGQNAFEGCKSLSNVKISNSMTSIPASMFADCVSLSAIEIPTSIEVIGNYAFSGCTSLKDFEIPENVLTIGAYAFYGCRNLSSIIIPKSVTDIYADAFDNCPNLTIYGYADSYAETYANENEIPFVRIDDSEQPNNELIITIPSNVIVTRGDDVLNDGDAIITGDTLEITVNIPDGYKLNSLTLNGFDIENGWQYIVNETSVIINVEFEEIYSDDIDPPTNEEIIVYENDLVLTKDTILKDCIIKGNIIFEKSVQLTIDGDVKAGDIISGVLNLSGVSINWSKGSIVVTQNGSLFCNDIISESPLNSATIENNGEINCRNIVSDFNTNVFQNGKFYCENYKGDITTGLKSVTEIADTAKLYYAQLYGDFICSFLDIGSSGNVYAYGKLQASSISIYGGDANYLIGKDNDGGSLHINDNAVIDCNSISVSDYGYLISNGTVICTMI